MSKQTIKRRQAIEIEGTRANVGLHDCEPSTLPFVHISIECEVFKVQIHDCAVYGAPQQNNARSIDGYDAFWLISQEHSYRFAKIARSICGYEKVDQHVALQAIFERVDVLVKDELNVNPTYESVILAARHAECCFCE